MAELRDPAVRAAIVELGFAAPEAPSWHEIETAAAPRRGRSAPGWVVAAAVAAAVLILVGAPAWLLLRAYETSPEVVDEPSPTAVVSTMAPTTVAPVVPTVTTTPAPTAPTTTTTGLPGGLEVRIEGEITFGWDFSSNVWDEAPFVASGPAVDAGVMCEGGIMDLRQFDQGLGTWRTEVRYTCADGSGTLLLSFDVRPSYVDGVYTETGTWVVSYGTGPYEGIMGRGTDETFSPEADRYITVQEGLMAPRP